MPDDREIWRRMMQNEVAAFDAFYRAHAPRLQTFLRQIVGSYQAAEDIAQEAFTQVWKHPGGFDPERGTLRAYVFGIGRKQAAEWWRRQRPAEAVVDDRAAKCNPETESLVGDAFQRLPPEQRTLLWLREVEGYSYAELATALEIPIGTVRSRLFAAREALRKIWHSTTQITGGPQ